MSESRARAPLGVLAFLLLVSCTGDPAPAPSTPLPVAADAERDVNPQPRERLRDGGLLRFPITALPTEWNPRHPDADADTAAVLAPLAPPHFSLDAAGRVTPDPDFITGLAVENTDRTVVTLDLNDRSLWGDAVPITASDWIATWRAASGQVDGVRLADATGWERVTEVREGVSPRQVVVTYGALDPDWAQPLVAGPLRGADIGAPDSFAWSGYVDGRYASPFMVTHVDQNQGLVTLERNPLWWGERPKLDTIMFRTVADEALAAAFQNNELDVWETGASTDRLDQSRVAADSVIRSAPGTSGRELQVSRGGALADPAVRRAVLMALDRDDLGRPELPDGAKKLRTWSNTLLLPTQPGYVDQARATGLVHDPVRAGKLLDEAGWELESGRRVKDGQPLVVSFLTSPGDELATAELKDVADQLDAVGVVVSAASRDADLTPLTVAVSPFPLAHLPEEAVSAPGASELAGRVAHELDPVRRADQASQLARLLWQEVITVPLYQEPEFVAVRSGLANLGAHSYATTDWEDVGWTS